VIKLLQCKRCGKYTVMPMADITVRFPVMWYEDNEEVSITDDDVRNDWPKGTYTLSCPAYDEETKDTCAGVLEVVELEQCPHYWEQHWRGRAYRRCILCDQEQTGRVVFEEEAKHGTQTIR